VGNRLDDRFNYYEKKGVERDRTIMNGRVR